MRTANRFAIAIHILSILGSENDQEPTSEWMAGSIGVNAVVVRNITGMLRRAGIVHTHQGVAGAHLTRLLEDISLLDVYRAVEDDNDLFAIHPRPNPNCPIGANIQHTLEQTFGTAQQAMEAQLARTKLADIVYDLHKVAVVSTSEV